MSNKQTTIAKDADSKKITVIREFDAPLDLVWKAWTESKILDSWWAPRPWTAKTKSMDFREGGFWLYSMVGPDGSKQFCRVDYITVVPLERYAAKDAFCDENGNKINEFPAMHWFNEFSKTDTGTLVKIEITFESEADMNKIIEMGFETGFTAAHSNLDEVLANEVNSY